MSFSPAMLLDRKALRQSLVNGTSPSLSPVDSDPTISFQGARQVSEPPQTSTTNLSLVPILSAKDDAHDVTVCKGRTQKAPHSQAQPSAPKSLFDAKQLLDPKSFQKSPQSMLESGKRDVEEAEPLSAGSLIERMHNVSQREERPFKKQKNTDNEPNDKDAKAHFTGGGKGGDLGEYVKDERKKGLEYNGANATIDLTATGKLISIYIFHLSWHKEDYAIAQRVALGCGFSGMKSALIFPSYLKRSTMFK